MGGALSLPLDAQALLRFLGTLEPGERLQVFLIGLHLALTLFFSLQCSSALCKASEILLCFDLALCLGRLQLTVESVQTGLLLLRLHVFRHLLERTLGLYACLVDLCLGLQGSVACLFLDFRQEYLSSRGFCLALHLNTLCRLGEECLSMLDVYLALCLNTQSLELSFGEECLGRMCLLGKRLPAK